MSVAAMLLPVAVLKSVSPVSVAAGVLPSPTAVCSGAAMVSVVLLSVSVQPLVPQVAVMVSLSAFTLPSA